VTQKRQEPIRKFITRDASLLAIQHFGAGVVSSHLNADYIAASPLKKRCFWHD